LSHLYCTTVLETRHLFRFIHVQRTCAVLFSSPRLVMLRRKTGGVGQSLLCKTLQLIRRFPTPPFLVSASLASSFAGKEIRVPKGIEANSTIFLLWPISLAASCFKHAAISSLPPDNAVTSPSVYHLIREIEVSRGHSGHTRTEGYQVRSIEGGSLFLLTCSWRGKGGCSPIRMKYSGEWYDITSR